MKQQKRKKTQGRSRGDWLFELGLLIVVIIVAVGSVWYGLRPAGEQVRSQESTTIHLYTLPAGDPTLTTCISPDKISMRLSVHLKIIINNSEVRIPARIGQDQNCVRPVHTKDSSGTIYVESPTYYPYTLKDFFAVWNQFFTKDRLFYLRANDNHKITITVNGQQTFDYEDHVLVEGEEIVISYT